MLIWPLKFIEHFHKPAHVRALEMMRQVDIHVDGGVDRLRAARAVQDDDRILDVFHADLFNVNIAKIFLVLNINHNKKVQGSYRCEACEVQGTSIRGSMVIRFQQFNHSPSTIHHPLFTIVTAAFSDSHTFTRSTLTFSFFTFGCREV